VQWESCRVWQVVKVYAGMLVKGEAFGIPVMLSFITSKPRISIPKASLMPAAMARSVLLGSLLFRNPERDDTLRISVFHIVAP